MSSIPGSCKNGIFKIVLSYLVFLSFECLAGARIDHAHHGGVAFKALTDTLALEKAVETALDLVNVKETLIIVTADHGSDMGMAGYQPRGTPIFGMYFIIIRSIVNVY